MAKREQGRQVDTCGQVSQGEMTYECAIIDARICVQLRQYSPNDLVEFSQRMYRKDLKVWYGLDRKFLSHKAAGCGEPCLTPEQRFLRKGLVTYYFPFPSRSMVLLIVVRLQHVFICEGIKDLHLSMPLRAGEIDLQAPTFGRPVDGDQQLQLFHLHQERLH